MRQVVEKTIQANLTAMQENYHKAGDSFKSKFVSMLWNLGYVIGSIAALAVGIAFGFGCFSVWRHIKFGKKIASNSNVIDLILQKTKIFG